MKSEIAESESEIYKRLSNIAKYVSNNYNSISNKPDSVSNPLESGINIYKHKSKRYEIVTVANKRLSEIHNSKSKKYDRNYISSLRNFSLLTILFSGDEAPYSDFTYCFTIIASLYSPVVG